MNKRLLFNLLTTHTTPLLLCICLLIATVQVSHAQAFHKQEYRTNKIRDLALIYQGGTHRLDWTESDFLPFVVHTYADGRKDWLFDGFLFLEFADGKGRTYASGFAKTTARKGEWEWLLDRLYAKDKSLDALDQCIRIQKKILGKPKFKHQIVLGLPMAHEKQTDWGELNGKTMDFSMQDDQLEAICWYMDELVERFRKAKYENLELAGFYWVEEDTIYCRDITVPLSKRIHAQKKMFYWIPYWKARGYAQWKELGFDIAYLQPNHFFKATIPDERLDEACEVAKGLNMALEFEFDKKALFQAKQSFDRMKAYIDYFEKHGVFDESAIAYYSGTDGMLRMSQSTSPEDKLLMDRLAKLIVERRKKKKL